MNTQELTTLTANLLTKYYENDIQPFLDYCHEDVLWLGPAKNQIIRTRDALVESFGKEEHVLKFAVDNLTATPLVVSSHCLEVLLTFMVDTFWPDGGTNRVHQRISFTWCIEKGKPLIRFLHISNSIDYDNRDNIYPVHYLENHQEMTLYTDSSSKLFFKGVKGSILYTSPNQIVYIESKKNHSLIHLNTHTFECINRVADLENITKGYLIRCHSSYLVNPIHVKEIERFNLTLLDDTKIPIPEKKYTAVKAKLLNK